MCRVRKVSAIVDSTWSSRLTATDRLVFFVPRWPARELHALAKHSISSGDHKIGRCATVSSAYGSAYIKHRGQKWVIRDSSALAALHVWWRQNKQQPAEPSHRLAAGCTKSQILTCRRMCCSLLRPSTNRSPQARVRLMGGLFTKTSQSGRQSFHTRCVWRSR